VRSNSAASYARKGHTPNRDAKLFVRAAWEAQRAEYKNNKSAFVRDFVGIVANKFQDTKGNPLKITEKQMREVWLGEPRLPILGCPPENPFQ
ncbi:MAG: hypothetical protein WA924_11625, partial [Burkholderiaceae bacterium]